MTKLISVQFQNFQAYGNVPTKIDLTKIGTTMISGTNGTGKSTIINAISYGLYDKPVSDISKDGLINNINGKNMEVVVEFEKNSHTYKVRRHRKMKGNGVTIWEDDNDITPDSIGNTNSLVENILGMPHELFVRVIIFSAINTQFLNLPMRSQADMLEELLDLKMLSDKAVVLKEQIKDTNRSLEIESEHIVQANKDCHRFMKQYQQAYTRATDWDEKQKEEIATVADQVRKLNEVDIDAQVELHSKSDHIINVTQDVKHSLETRQRDLVDAEDVIKNLKHAKESSDGWKDRNTNLIEEITNDINTYNDMDIEGQQKLIDTAVELTEASDDILVEQNQITSDLADLHKIITTNTNELDHLSDNECPYCKQQFKETKAKIKECTTNIKAAEKEKKVLTTKLEECVEDNNALSTQIEKISSSISYTASELKKANIQIVRLTDKLDNAKAAENGWIPEIEDLEKIADPKKVAELEKIVVSLQTEIAEYDEELYAITELRTMSPSQMDAFKQEKAVTVAKLKDLKTQENTLNQPLHDLENEWYDEEAEKTFLQLFKELKLPVKHPDQMFEAVAPTIMDVATGTPFIYVQGSKRSNQLHKLSDHQKFLLKLLTSKDSFIRKSMLNQSIPYLNKQLDGYLKTMGLPHAVAFTPKMEVTIHKLGKSLQYGNLSNGQQCRVNLALSFAFRDVLQMLHDQINVLVLDEVLDVGLDSEGISNAAGMIKQKAINDDAAIFVISHREEIDNTFNDKIMIELIDGFSKVIE